MTQEILTKSECFQIICNALKIHKSENISVKEFILVPLNDEVLGFMGEYFTLIITVIIGNAKQQKLNFFVKSIPVTNVFQRKEVETRGVFNKEVYLYSDLFKDMHPFVSRKWHPDCFYTRQDILILEDLSSIGYAHIHGEFSINYLEAGLKCIADMHATSLAYEIKTGSSIAELSEKIFERQVIAENSWFQTGLVAIKAIALNHEKFQSKNYQNFISEQLISSFYPIYEMVNASKVFRNVLCHRDIWNRNIFFKSNSSSGKLCECVLVDFQLVRYHPPSIDVLFFLYQLNRSIRNEIFEYSLKFYYQSLNELLQEQNISTDGIMEWNEFRQSCETFKLLILVLNAVYTPLTQIPNNFINTIKVQDPVKYNHYMTENRDEMILELMEKNHQYRKRVLETVEELIDYIYMESF